jgi:hypothetical protein
MCISYEVGAQGQLSGAETSDTDADRAQKRFVLETSQAKAIARNAARKAQMTRNCGAKRRITMVTKPGENPKKPLAQAA